MPKTVTRSDAFVRAAMQEHGASVLRLALSQTSSMADAEDVYQDVFVSLACSKASFENADHLRAWLLRVTLNRCRDLARSWWRRKARSLDALEFDPPDDSDSTGAPADYAELWHAIHRLPKRDQVLIHLRYVEEMSCERISAVTGIKASTVRTRLSRTHQKLQTMLGEDDETI